MNIKQVGDGKVVLLAGGGKIYTDIAARFCRSEKSLDEIIASPYDKNIVKNILDANHLAATEFDYFIFGIEGYARVTEVQLVRKRMASYLIKSGRVEKNGKRSFDMVVPKDNIFMEAVGTTPIDIRSVEIYDESNDKWVDIWEYFPGVLSSRSYRVKLSTMQILGAIETWYDNALARGVKEEDARYLKPQATEFKAIIGLNIHGLLDWFKIRCCRNAQSEISDLARKMLKLCKEAAPDLFENAGASCVALGYCPENKRQNIMCKGIVPTLNDVKALIKDHYKRDV